MKWVALLLCLIGLLGATPIHHKRGHQNYPPRTSPQPIDCGGVHYRVEILEKIKKGFKDNPQLGEFSREEELGDLKRLFYMWCASA